MINRKFVASQLRKLAAKMEEDFSFEEAEERGDFKAIYDHLVERSFRKDWWRKILEYSNDEVPILLPSDGSENNRARKIIWEYIKEDIEFYYNKIAKEFNELHSKTNPSQSEKDRFEYLKKEFAEKYGYKCIDWKRKILFNKETIKEFFDHHKIYEDYEELYGNWDFGSPLKKYTFMLHQPGTSWWVYTSNSPEEILKEAGEFVWTGNDWEELADKLYYFPY